MLRWSPLLDFGETVDWTTQWYRALADGKEVAAMTMTQVDRYLGQRVRLVSPFTQNSPRESVESERLLGNG
jgi:CDP-glucose 4,6-dehydratase